MKISKVNNYKTAVTGRGGAYILTDSPGEQSKGRTGILYRDPPKNKKSVESDIARHVERQTMVAQRLYRLVNPLENGKKRTLAMDVASILDRSVDKKDLQRDALDAHGMYGNLLSSWTDARITASDGQIDEAVDLYLRKSLHQTSASDVKAMLKAAAQGRRWNELSDSERSSIRGFVDCLQKDYGYEKVRKHVVKSIEHQNIVIQPNEAGILEPALIPLASERNKLEKDAMKGFLSEYAALDDAVRHDLRLRLRRLLDLYFYGFDEVPVEDFDEWMDHASHRGRTEPFSAEAAAYIQKVREEDAARAAKKEAQGKKVSPSRYGKERIRIVRQLFRQENMQRYRKAHAAVEADSELFFSNKHTSRFWLHHIENSVERIYKTFRSLEDYRLSLGYISEKVWKGMLSFLSGKYIATGKAVWHFAMKEGIEDETKDLKLSRIREDVRRGLTSFDYEQIKAEEVLQRDMAVYVAFASNHLSSATVDLSILDGEEGKEDFLLLKREDLEKSRRPHLRRNLLQFFGGESTWQDFSFEKYYQEYSNANSTQYDDLSLLADLQQIVYAARNESFHFDTRRRNPGNWNQSLISAMFAHDCKTASTLQKEKFYSNNLPMFYGEKDLLDLLRVLYGKQTARASQVPSFNKVVVRRNFSDFISDNLNWKNINFTGEGSVALKEQFDSALYYLLKEIYYNLFLQGSGSGAAFDVKGEFIKWCLDEKNGKQNAEAFKSFKSRVEEIISSKKDITLPEICQRIMTDYNLYNNGTRKVKSDSVKQNMPDSYDHFKMLLLKGLREVFASYICAEFAVLKNPRYREKPDADAFLPDYSSPTYSTLIERVKGNPELQKWYVVGRLLNPRQANFFVGVLRQYIQYTGQIRRRAVETGSRMVDTASAKALKGYANVLEVCIQLAGMTTNCLTDYFDDKDDYARHISRYLDFEGIYPGISISAQLENFCNENATDIDQSGVAGSNSANESGSDELKRLGLFYDAENPILNRNILLSKIYGTEKILVNIEKNRKITRDEIRAFYEQREKIGDYRLTGKCSTEEQQRALKKYQEIKNRVEFRDLVEYEEIVDEMQAQMIDWCYLRERDLMYFQLGFHYMCLCNSSSKAELYRGIEKDGRKIDGAILYQIAAMYINGLPIYAVEKGKIKRKSESMSAGGKIRVFLNYAGACVEQAASSKEAEAPISADAAERFYLAGMELFENTQEHDNIVALRNYIEHFHYYVHQDRSLLDLYGEIFDRFFTYDMKYQKNVCNILYNILMHHFVRPAFTFSKAEKQVGKITKDRASISLVKKKGLSSEKMTYKLATRNKKQQGNTSSADKSSAEEAKKIDLPARSRDFLEGVAVLLSYRMNPEMLLLKKDRTTDNHLYPQKPGRKTVLGGKTREETTVVHKR